MVRIALSWIAAALLWATAVQAQDFTLRPGDVVDISVLEDPSLNRQALIRPDGKISLPIAGTLQAADRTPEQLQAAIRRALAGDFLQAPTVTVALSRLGSGAGGAADLPGQARIYVIGQVNRPGALDVQTPITALQALALAGGAGAFAASDRIQIRRMVGGRSELLLFNYDILEDGAVPDNDLAMRDGDVLLVPQRGLFE